MRARPRSGAPRRGRVDLGEVLREYREYERAMTTLVDAAVKPRVGRLRGHHPRRGSTERGAPAVPFYIDEVQRRRAVGRRGRSTSRSPRCCPARPRARSGAALVDAGPPASTASSPSTAAAPPPTSAVVVDGRAGAHHRGHGRRATRRKIPMIDVVTVGAGGGSVAWLSREGTLKVGPRSAGADPGPLCYGKRRHRADRHRRPRRSSAASPPHLLGGEMPLDVEARRRRAASALGAQARPRPRAPPPPASWRSRPGTRPTRCARSPSQRGLDVRDFVLATFGGSGSLLPAGCWTSLGLPAARGAAATPATCRRSGC